MLGHVTAMLVKESGMTAAELRVAFDRIGAGLCDGNCTVRPTWTEWLDSPHLTEQDYDIILQAIKLGVAVSPPSDPDYVGDEVGAVRSALSKRSAIDSKIDARVAEIGKVRRQLAALASRRNALDSELLALRIERERYDAWQESAL